MNNSFNENNNFINSKPLNINEYNQGYLPHSNFNINNNNSKRNRINNDYNFYNNNEYNSFNEDDNFINPTPFNINNEYNQGFLSHTDFNINNNNSKRNQNLAHNINPYYNFNNMPFNYSNQNNNFTTITPMEEFDINNLHLNLDKIKYDSKSFNSSLKNNCENITI